MKKLLSLLVFLIAFMSCYAEEIKIDGDFSDWVDKPAITSDDNVSDIVTPVDEPAQPEISFDDTSSEPESSSNMPESEPDLAASEPSPSAENTSETGLQSSQEDAQTESLPAEPDNEIQENNNDPKTKISQLKWNMSENSDILYIMLRISHFNDTTGEVTTELTTDFGRFIGTTTYNTEDKSVLTQIAGHTSLEGKCEVINKNQLNIEYAIPVEKFIENMKWGYMIKMRVMTADDVEPTKGYIMISTASSSPYLGVGISVGLCILIPYIRRKIKK